MAGKHAAPSSGSKKPLIIIISVVVALAIAGTSVFFILTANRNKNQQTIATTAATAATTVPNSTSATAPTGQAPTTSSGGTEQETTSASSHSDSEQETTMNINIPTEEGSTVSYFNASYIPSGEVIDLSTGESVSLRDVFGETYPGGALTFNDDGTFVDTIGSSGMDSGEYLVENGEIKATYIYDRNMNITVLEWNDETKAPSSFYITYGNGDNGYQVYFSEN